MMSWTRFGQDWLAACARAPRKKRRRVLVWVAVGMTYRHGWPSEIVSEFSTESRARRVWRGEHMSSIEKLGGVTLSSLAGQHFPGQNCGTPKVL